MNSVEERERVRRAYFIEKKTQRQIAKELHMARKTVRKAIESAEPGAYKLREPCAAPVLEQYKARIDQLLREAAVHRAQDFPVAATRRLSRR